jgi:hypothetical protein
VKRDIGALPLDVLEERTKDWVAEQKRAGQNEQKVTKETKGCL